MRETWYVLEDGNVASPNECAPDAKGKLVHESGVPVAMRGEVPSSRGVDVDEQRDMKPAKKRGYKTRESKAD